MNINSQEEIKSSFNYPKLIFIGFLILIVVLIKFLSPEDNWNCKNGEWVKHGNPSISRPDTNCSGVLKTNP